MTQFIGNEIFELQNLLRKRVGGFFGLNKKELQAVAIALDAAVAFGKLHERKFADQLKDEELIKILHDKILRLAGGDF